MKTRTYQVNEVARITGVSVRTLHHYDKLGLLVPSTRTTAGYRLYTDADLLRMQQILIGRELGLALEDIRRMLDDPRVSRRQLLQQQRERLLQRARTTAAMIRSVDGAMALLDEDQSQRTTTMDMKEIFDGFDPAQYEQEARERWGHTEAYRESERRTRGYTQDDWKRMKEETDAIMSDAAAAMNAGSAPTDATVMDIAERHRLSIDRWFYPCSAQMHAALADMYEADARFASNIDKHADGLTAFWSAAIRANALRA
jgi:MerR family transcriptional regulator, thiopeptide resistance regulator